MDLGSALKAGDGEYLLDVALRDVEQRYVALTFLSLLRDPETAPGVARLLRAGDPVARYLAATALGDIGSPTATEPLIQCLEDEDNAGVRREAVKALGRIGDAAATPAIREVLRTTDDPAFEAAAVASARLRDRDALPLLGQALENMARRDERRRVVKRAIRGIESQAGWQPSPAQRALVRAARLVGHERWWIRSLVGGSGALAIIVARHALPTWVWLPLLVAWLAFAFGSGLWLGVRRMRKAPPGP